MGKSSAAMPDSSPHFESLPSTSLDPQPGTCPRCGFRADPEAETCPRCRTELPRQPDVRVARPSERSGEYIERVLDCAPAELEALARREAVDGWELVDTTVDPSSPDRLQAHFRRPAPAQTAARETAETQTAHTRPDRSELEKRAKKQKRAKSMPSRSATSKTQKPAAPKPAEQDEDEPDGGPIGNERIFWATILISAGVLMSEMEWIGLMIAIFAVPPAARMISRLSPGALFLLAIATGILVSNMSWIGLMIALFALPGILQGLVSKPD